MLLAKADATGTSRWERRSLRGLDDTYAYSYIPRLDTCTEKHNRFCQHVEVIMKLLSSVYIIGIVFRI